MDQMRNSPLGLSTSQAASALGVSLGTIRRWADMGYLESYRTPGGQRRFSVEQIEQFLETLQQRRSGQQQHQRDERLVS
jgi:excisionase family DNA binding protein